MNGRPDWVERIESRSGGKPVLLVEGDDDVPLFRHFLDQQVPGWDLRLYLASAGGKARVISGVAVHHPDWIGIVDSDEWSQQDIEEEITRSPRLQVLPRFCIESYFCHPQELWAALPQVQRDHVDNDVQKLTQPIMMALPDWVMHGAMWRVLRRIYKDARLPAQLEREPVTDEANIRTILQTWHDRLAPNVVMEQYHAELNKAQRLSHDEQLMRYIHGKKFYNQVVVQVLDPTFAGAGADFWLEKFRDANIEPPSDLRNLLDSVLSLIP